VIGMEEVLRRKHVLEVTLRHMLRIL